MQQVDAGKLDLDAPVDKYLNGLHVPNPLRKRTPSYRRHLLSHHGGIPNGAPNGEVVAAKLPSNLEEVVHKRVKVTRKPGEGFQYSNYGFAPMAIYWHSLKDMTFERALKSGAAGALGMTKRFSNPRAP